MLVLSLMMLLLTFLTFRLAQTITDEIGTIILGLTGTFCLLVSLINAPWIVLLLIALTLFLTSACAKNSHRLKVSCSRACLLRSQCDVLHE